MPIDKEKYDATKAEFKRLCQKFNKNRELRDACERFCAPSFAHPIVDACGQEFRSRQCDAEGNFNHLVDELSNAIGTVAIGTADSRYLSAITEAVSRWEAKKHEARFQHNFRNYMEKIMPNQIKNQLSELLTQTTECVKAYKEKLERYNASEGQELSSKDRDFLDAVIGRLTTLRSRLEDATIADTNRSMDAAREIRKSLEIIRTKLPAGRSDKIGDELCNIENKLRDMKESAGTGGESIRSLGERPFSSRDQADLLPFAEIGRERKKIVENVDELEAARFVLATLCSYNEFFEENQRKIIELIDQSSVQNIDADPIIVRYTQAMEGEYEEALRIGSKSPLYNKHLTRAKSYEAEIKKYRQRLEKSAKQKEEMLKSGRDILGEAQAKFQQVVMLLTSGSITSYRQRYKIIIEKHIFDLDDLLNELREAIFSDDTNVKRRTEKLDAVRAKIDSLIPEDFVSVVDFTEDEDADEEISEEGIRVNEPEEPIEDEEAVKRHLEEMRRARSSAFVSDSAPIREREAPDTEGPSVRTSQIPEDPTAAHVNTDPVEEPDSVVDGSFADVVKRVFKTDK